MSRASRVLFVVFAFLFITDLVLIALHVMFGWSVINLDEDANLTVWYSSTKLLAISVTAGALWAAERRCRKDARPFRLSVLWVAVALVFLGLSICETAQIHNRMARFFMEEASLGLDIRETVLDGDATKDSFAWVILFSPLVVATALFFLFFFFSRMVRVRGALIPAMLGLALFVLVVIMETTVYFSPPIQEWTNGNLQRYQLAVTVEEAAELLGSTLLLLAFVRYRLFLREAGAPTRAA